MVAINTTTVLFTSELVFPSPRKVSSQSLDSLSLIRARSMLRYFRLFYKVGIAIEIQCVHVKRRLIPKNNGLLV